MVSKWLAVSERMEHRVNSGRILYLGDCHQLFTVCFTITGSFIAVWQVMSSHIHSYVKHGPDTHHYYSAYYAHANAVCCCSSHCHPNLLYVVFYIVNLN